ncbi:PLP-dependent transferase [Terfezia boudieri ATCC MYA-4762]|uniref:Ornithine aminotransferase n=1 Tax=Terfezia boudieri ATCC MYA-4762 TaxID=1051890 RepID=A0A3N4M0M6_9PEZI|nr:PLP-dependent transferase [Terfezia boudieri ATCC MYA-4762]
MLIEVNSRSKLLCCEHSGVVLLGKAISGGVFPVSVVLADKDTMFCIEPGTHGSMYGGNPVGCAVAIAALEVVRNENLTERAESLGREVQSQSQLYQEPCYQAGQRQGAVVVDESKLNGHTAWELCLLLKKKGLLAKPIHQNIIHLAAPLVISEAQIDRATEISKEAVKELPPMKAAEFCAQGHHEQGVNIDS